MDSRTIIKFIEADGWRFKAAVGSHHQFTHPQKKGRVTVQHPRKDVPVGTRKKIEQQAGIVLQR